MNKQNGHTLIELVVVIMIVSILSMLSVPFVENMVISKKEKELEYRLWMIREAIDKYRDYKRLILNRTVNPEVYYPKNLQILVEGENDLVLNNGSKIKFLREIPRDPFADTNLKPEETWEIIYYNTNNTDSSTIFDVKSKKNGISLNGTNYYDW